MHLPEIDRYAYLKSPFHSWDPRVKLISISFLLLSIVLVTNLLVASFGLIIAIVLVFLSRIPLHFVFVHLRWVLLFILFFFIVMPLTVPGDEIFKLNFVNVSYKGIKLAFLIGLRAISAVLLIFPMIDTMRFDLTIKALHRLKAPSKFIQMTMFTYRYIFVLLGELGRMSTAAEARLFKKKVSIHTLKMTGNLIGMLFIRGFERTQRVYNAMASRGYKGSLKTLEEFKLSKMDFLKASFIITLAIALNLVGLFL